MTHFGFMIALFTFHCGLAVIMLSVDRILEIAKPFEKFPRRFLDLSPEIVEKLGSFS